MTKPLNPESLESQKQKAAEDLATAIHEAEKYASIYLNLVEPPNDGDSPSVPGDAYSAGLIGDIQAARINGGSPLGLPEILLLGRSVNHMITALSSIGPRILRALGPFASQPECGAAAARGDTRIQSESTPEVSH